MKRLAWTKRKSALTLTLCAIIATSTIIILQNTKTTQAALIDPHPGLVGWWRFDEGTGTAAGDSSGNGNNGTVYSANWVLGKYGNALSFNGLNSYVGVSSGLNCPTTAITLFCWIKIGGQSSVFQSPLLLGGGNSALLYFVPNSNIVVYKFSSIGGIRQEKNIATIDANWHNVAVTFDGSSVKGYVDGILLTTSAASGIISYSDSSCFFGNANGNYFNGIIDDVRVYNRSLSAAEIQAIIQQSPDFSSQLLAKIPKGTTQVITTLSWQGDGNINATITSPSQTYTEDLMPAYYKTTYSTTNGVPGMLNIKRLSISVNTLSSDQSWNISLTSDIVTAYQITVEVQK